jgi:TRAP-type mannitol/chloroaromatic compound transport system substrate-binding protein
MYSFYVNTEGVGEAAEGIPGRVRGRAYEANLDMMAEYDFKNPARAALAGRQRREAARLLARDHARRLRARPRPLRRGVGEEPSFKKIYEPWRKFRDELTLWHSVAEQTYSSFIQSPADARGTR